MKTSLSDSAFKISDDIGKALVDLYDRSDKDRLRRVALFEVTQKYGMPEDGHNRFSQQYSGTTKHRLTKEVVLKKVLEMNGLPRTSTGCFLNLFVNDNGKYYTRTFTSGERTSISNYQSVDGDAVEVFSGKEVESIRREDDEIIIRFKHPQEDGSIAFHLDLEDMEGYEGERDDPIYCWSKETEITRVNAKLSKILDNFDEFVGLAIIAIMGDIEKLYVVLTKEKAEEDKRRAIESEEWKAGAPARAEAKRLAKLAADDAKVFAYAQSRGWTIETNDGD